MRIYGLVAEKNLYSYTEVLGKLASVGKQQAKKEDEELELAEVETFPVDYFFPQG